MKIFLLLLGFCAFALAGSSPKGRFRNHYIHGAGDKFRAGEVLVKFSERSSFEANRTHLRGRYRAKDSRKIDSHGLMHVKIRDGQTVEQAVAELSKDPAVEFVQPNYLRKLTQVPNDTFYAAQWGLKNTGQTISKATLDVISATTNDSSFFSSNNPPSVLNDMGLETAWDLHTDCSAITVAVIDTGVNYNHEDLVNNMWTDASFPNHGYDFLDNDNDPMDPMITSEGHGTHVAGIIGAEGNNGKGIAGVCWTAKIMALRAGNGDGLTTAAIVASVNFAVAHGAKIINMSYGADSISAPEATAYANAIAAGVLLVAAAGNGDTAGNGVDNDANPFYPCNVTGVLCVAALDQGYALTSFSNYGATSVHVAAPGQNVISAANAYMALYSGEASGTPDPLTSWTVTQQFGILNSAGTGNVNSVVLPSNYDGAVTYAASKDSRAYRTFDLSTFSDALLQANIKLSSQANTDILSIGISGAGGEPFSTNGNLAVTQLSGTVSDTYTIPLHTCLTAACSFGLAFQSNADATVGTGLLLNNLYVITASANTGYYRVLSGTSMATPYVVGLAALVWSYNPTYSMADVITALEQGGVTQAGLVGKVSTGKAVSAIGALRYINVPTGVSASVH